MKILDLIKNNINSIYVKYLRDDEIVEEPIFYIAGSQTLPPPLSEEEEEKYIKKLSDEDNLEARQVLIERNLRLVVYIAKKFENTGIGIEDLISIGTIGLMKGVNTFNADKNIKLATYSSRCIENEILMYLRRTNKTKGEISIDEPLNKDCDGNELLLSDILGTEPDITSRNLEDEVDKTLLKASIANLNDREKTIMEMRFGFVTGNEKTQKEVADELGISQSYISRLEKKIIGKMKREILSKTGWLEKEPRYNAAGLKIIRKKSIMLLLFFFCFDTIWKEKLKKRTGSKLKIEKKNRSKIKAGGIKNGSKKKI